MSDIYHPAANVFPLMSEDDLRRLVEDIRENGQREAVVYWENKILDGRNRHKACEVLGVEPATCELERCDDPVAYVISANLHRRQLKTSQRAMCAAKLAGLPHGTNRHTRAELSNDNSTIADAALLFSVGTASVSRALDVLRDGCDALVRMCELGELSVSTACTFMEMTTKQIERKVVKHGAKAVRDYIKALRDKHADDVEVRPEGDVPHFVQFKAVWDAADDMGKAAIRAFIIGEADE